MRQNEQESGGSHVRGLIAVSCSYSDGHIPASLSFLLQVPATTRDWILGMESMACGWREGEEDSTSLNTSANSLRGGEEADGMRERSLERVMVRR